MPLVPAVSVAPPPLPDSIIASSNRYEDLRPYCDIIRHAEPEKWNDVLPWEFPENASKKVEDAFIRQFFSDLEIHMQGGSQGQGEGVRFLKQAWYGIAIDNAERRIPQIAQWWMDQPENKSYLEDPDMLGHLLNPEVVPETIFQPAELKLYGPKLLKYAVRTIHGIAASKKQKDAEKDVVENEASVTALSKVDSITSEAKSTIAATSPFPAYTEPVLPPSRVTSGEFEPDRNIQFLKQRRGMSNGKRALSGYNSYADGRHPSRQQDRNDFTQYPAAFGMHPSNISAAHGHLMPSQMRGPSGGGPTHFAMLQQQTAGPPGFPPQSPYSPSTPTQFAAQLTAQQHALMMQGGGFPPSSHSNVVPERTSYEGGNSGRWYNNEAHFAGQEGQYSKRGNRHNSQRSRGGSIRGGRSGYGRGGRGSNTGSMARPPLPDEAFFREPSNDFEGQHRSFGSKGRRGGVIHEGTWRSASDHPQAQPVVGGPMNPQFFSRGPAVASPERLAPTPAIPLPVGATTNASKGREIDGHNYRDTSSQSEFQQPAPANTSTHPDDHVSCTSIGNNCTRVNKLVMFDVPPQMPEIEIIRLLSQAGCIDVVDIRKANAYIDQSACLAFLTFGSHTDAQRALTLNGTEFLGRRFKIEVSKEFWDPTNVPYKRRYGSSHLSPEMSGSRVFSNGGGHRHMQDPHQPNMQAFQQPVQTQPRSHANLPRWPVTEQPSSAQAAVPQGPTTAVDVHMPSAAVKRGSNQHSPTKMSQSENMTPTTTANSTPKKKKQNKKNKDTLGKNSKPLLNDALEAAAGQQESEAKLHDMAHYGPTMEQLSPVWGPTLARIEAERSKVINTERSKVTPTVDVSNAEVAPSTTIAEAVEEHKAGPVKIEQAPGHVQPPEIGTDTTIDAPNVPEGPATEKQMDPDHLPDRHAYETTGKEQSTDPSPAGTNQDSDHAAIPQLAVDKPAVDKPAKLEEDLVDDSFHTASASTPGGDTSSVAAVESSVKQVSAPVISNDNDAHKSSPVTLPEPSSTPVSPNATRSPIDTSKEAAPELPTVTFEENLLPKIVLPPKVVGNDGERTVSGNTIPPTPADAYHTAPTTPAITGPVSPVTSQTSEKAAIQKKAEKAEKSKGPSHTESLSLFGKKQEKKKKPAKGKASIRGKPKQHDGVGSGNTSRVVSGTTTPVPATDASLDTSESMMRKKDSAVETAHEPSIAKTSIPGGDNSDKKAAPSSNEPSPSRRKSTFGGLLGIFSSRTSSSSQPTSSDAKPDEHLQDTTLTDAKPQVSQMPSADFDFEVPSATTAATDVAASRTGSVANNPAEQMDASAESVVGLGIDTEQSTQQVPDSRPKSKKKKKSKGKKKNVPVTGEIADANEDDEVIEDIERSFPPSGQYPVPSDDPGLAQSETSSQTMGRTTPPGSPGTEIMTPTRKMKIEAAKEASKHLVEAKPARNIHKRKASSKMAVDQADTKEVEPEPTNMIDISNTSMIGEISRLIARTKTNRRREGSSASSNILLFVSTLEEAPREEVPGEEAPRLTLEKESSDDGTTDEDSPATESGSASGDTTPKEMAEEEENDDAAK